MNNHIRLIGLLLSLLALPGCGGCGKTEGEDAKKKEKEKQLDPLEARLAVVQPVVGRSGSCKPGHWMSGLLADAQANRDDFQGELDLRVVDYDKNEQLAPLYASPYEMTTSRPAVLAKGHPKSFESFFWAPWLPESTKKYSLVMRLAANSGLEIRPSVVLHAMPSYQYFFVVLSRKPARYDFLEKRFDCIRPLRATLDTADETNDRGRRSETANYRVSLIEPKGHAKLPSQALYWTSIAVLLWDDADPLELDAQQQTALIDWLHWGGRLIVSGPDSLETLRSSFLGPYLPAEASGTSMLMEPDLTELKHWSGEKGLAPKALKGWSAIKLVPRPDSRNVFKTGKDLVVEKAVGRGTIVATAFRLSTKELLDWKYYDCFFNACLLGRPPRELVPGAKENELVAVELRKPDKPDARDNTSVRYFSRDEQLGFREYSPDVAQTANSDQQDRSLRQGFQPNYNTGLDGMTDSAAAEEAGGPGIGAWNDFGPVPSAARSILIDAAGMRVPDRSFIVKIVVAYLVLLVPLNWLIFRAIGRVEWAWVAAPFIAVGGTVAVIRLAQLNVGFAQAQHEVDVVEMHAGYSRAHVTRYTVFYTSLASSYDFRMSDPCAQIIPFPRVSKPELFNSTSRQSPRSLDCRRNETTDLSGFYVPSNSIDFTHSETMADLGGSIVLGKTANGRPSVTNHTKLNLTNCVLLRAGGTSVGKSATVVGLRDLPPGGVSEVNFAKGRAIPDQDKAEVKDNSPGTVVGTEPDGREIVRKELKAPSRISIETDNGQASTSPTRQPSGSLKLNELQSVALNPREMRPGAIRLVAYTDDQLDGFNVSPSPNAQDIHRVTMIVVNLDAGRHPGPQPDYRGKPNPEISP